MTTKSSLGMTRVTRSRMTCESLPPEKEQTNISILLFSKTDLPCCSIWLRGMTSKLSQDSLTTPYSVFVFLESCCANCWKSTSGLTLWAFSAALYLRYSPLINSIASCSMRKIESSFIRLSASMLTGSRDRWFPEIKMKLWESYKSPPLVSNTISPL